MPDDLLGSTETVDMIACVDRELALRRKHYPRWVSSGKLTAVKAAAEIAGMQAVRDRLVLCHQIEVERPIMVFW